MASWSSAWRRSTHWPSACLLALSKATSTLFCPSLPRTVYSSFHLFFFRLDWRPPWWHCASLLLPSSGGGKNSKGKKRDETCKKKKKKEKRKKKKEKRKKKKEKRKRGQIERLTIARSLFRLRKTSCLLWDLRSAMSLRSSNACSTVSAFLPRKSLIEALAGRGAPSSIGVGV